MRCFPLFAEGDHRWLLFGQDSHRARAVVDSNQVVVCAGGSAMLLDPGGMEIFPMVVGSIVHEIDLGAVRHLFLSHQDPDVGSALPLWRKVIAPGASIYVAGLWIPYVAHFDADAGFTPIPDVGMEVVLSPQVTLHMLPAHYLHSSAAFCVYDSRARMLFSGDIGAAAIPAEVETHGIWVEDFAKHIPYMTGFHQRYLGSRKARDAWVAMVGRIAPDAIVPQHGLALRGPDVGRFLDWLSGLAIGSGIEAYGRAGAGISGAGNARAAARAGGGTC